jgi:hypothetical protein
MQNGHNVASAIGLSPRPAAILFEIRELAVFQRPAYHTTRAQCFTPSQKTVAGRKNHTAMSAKVLRPGTSRGRPNVFFTNFVKGVSSGFLIFPFSFLIWP